MTGRSKPTASEAWDAIDEASFRAEVDRVNAMSDAEVEAELVKDGFDPADLRSEPAKAAPVPVSSPAPAPPPAQVRRLPVRGRVLTWLAAAAMIVAVVGTMWRRNDDVTKSPVEYAARMRKEAEASCGKAQWRTCLDDLRRADEADPAGAGDPKVQELRKKAEQGLGGKGGAP